MGVKRKVISLILAVSFCVLSTTGILMYIRPFSKLTASIHTVFGFLFFVITFFHIINNIKPLKMYSLNVKKNFLSRNLLFSMMFLTIIFFGVFLDISGFNSLYNFGKEYRNSLEGIETLEDGTEIISFNKKFNEISIEIDAKKGRAFRYAMMVIWIEDIDGNYIQSLFVPKSIVTSKYINGKPDVNGIWKPAIVRRPESLPYWAHKRGVRAMDGLMIPLGKAYDIDAVSGATPKNDFTINSQAKIGQLKEFRVLLEINQSFDWNTYYHKKRFPNDEIYSGDGRVGQPAIVYAVEVDLDEIKTSKNYLLEPIGHSHHSGKTGELFEDFSNITTALEILDRVAVRVSKN